MNFDVPNFDGIGMEKSIQQPVSNITGETGSFSSNFISDIPPTISKVREPNKSLVNLALVESHQSKKKGGGSRRRMSIKYVSAIEELVNADRSIKPGIGVEALQRLLGISVVNQATDFPSEKQIKHKISN